LRRDTDALQRRVENRTNTIARTFDRVCAFTRVARLLVRGPGQSTRRAPGRALHRA
jgi:hypothetical protein